MNGGNFLVMTAVGALAAVALLVSTVAFGFAVFGSEVDSGGGGSPAEAVEPPPSRSC